MKKFGIILLIVAAACLGYWMGQQQARKPSAQSENIIETAVTESAIESETASSSDQLETQDKLSASRSKTDEQAEEKRMIDALIANHSYYADGAYREMLLRGGTYLTAIERFTPENGISEWGVTRSNQVNALLEQPEFSVLSNVEVECRITICLIRGEASTKSDASLIFEESNDIQYYGKHLGREKNQRGTYSFYVALYKLEND